MRKHLLALLLGSSLSLSAALPRTWVAHNGNDADNCSRATPCATLAGAYANTLTGGEIDVLDSGVYGDYTALDRDVTIDGGGNIVAGGAFSILGAVKVMLRNMTLATHNIGAFIVPVILNSGGNLRVEHVVIQADSSGAALQYGLVSAGGTASADDLRVEDSMFGVDATSAAKVYLNRCTLVHNQFGLTAVSGSLVQVDNSFFQFNSAAAVTTDSGNSSLIGGTIRLSNTTITDNAIGLQVGGTGTPAIISYGNNRIFGNTTNGNYTTLTTQR